MDLLLTQIALAAKAGKGVKWFIEQMPKEDGIEEEFQEKTNKYLGCKYLEFSEVRPLALKVKKKLKDIYYPLSLLPVDFTEDDYKVLKIKELEIESFFLGSSKVLIEDSAGMGKSTLMKILFLSYIETIFMEEKNEYIPIFIELRKYKAKESFENFILRNFLLLSELDEIKDIKNIEKIKDIFFKKKFIYFFDGFDEVVTEEKSNVIAEIKRVSNSYAKNYYILSSRSEGGVENFNNFFKYKIAPLKFEEGKMLLKKYVPLSLNDFFIQLDNNKEGLEEFLKTPLLASLIYAAYVYKNDIPTSKRDIYSRVYNALYEEHDSQSKENFVRSDLIEKEDLETILKDFAFSNIKDLKTNFRKDEIKDELEKILKKYGFNEKTKKILRVFTTGTCLFGTNGNEYFWSHKSMQEYFIAKKIKERNDKEKIMNYVINDKNNSRYYNLLSFLYEMEPILTKKIIYEAIEQEYKKYDKYPEEIKKLILTAGHVRLIKLTEDRVKELERLRKRRKREEVKKVLDILKVSTFRSFSRRNNIIILEEREDDVNPNNINNLLRLLSEKKCECLIENDYSIYPGILNEDMYEKDKIYSTRCLEEFKSKSGIERMKKIICHLSFNQTTIDRTKMNLEYRKILEELKEDEFEWS